MKFVFFFLDSISVELKVVAGAAGGPGVNYLLSLETDRPVTHPPAVVCSGVQ